MISIKKEICDDGFTISKEDWAYSQYKGMKNRDNVKIYWTSEHLILFIFLLSLGESI